MDSLNMTKRPHIQEFYRGSNKVEILILRLTVLKFGDFWGDGSW